MGDYAQTGTVFVDKPDLLRANKAEHRSFVAQAYARYHGEIVKFILRSYGEGPPSPQDVVQQAFLKLAQCEQPSQIRNMRAFLYKTSINIIIDHHRGEKRREKLLRHYSANGTYEKCDQIDPNAS